MMNVFIYRTLGGLKFTELFNIINKFISECVKFVAVKLTAASTVIIYYSVDRAPLERRAQQCRIFFFNLFSLKGINLQE